MLTQQPGCHAGGASEETPVPQVVFNKSEYDRFLLGFPSVSALAAKCDLQVMVELLRLSLHYGPQSYRDMHDAEAKKESKLICAIDGLQAAAEIIRDSGQGLTKEEVVLEECESRFREILMDMKSDPDVRPKALGAYGGHKPPGAPVYQACLEEYIAAKLGRRPRPSETSRIVSALFTGLGRYPNADIDPDALAKKLNRFRQRNPRRLEAIRRDTKCDPSGENELDRKFRRPAAG